MLVRGRIDVVAGVDDATLKAWLMSVGTDLIIVHHILPQVEGTKWDTERPYQDTTNPHYHFYLNTSYKSVQSLGYQLKKAFGSLSKSDWSIKPCDPTRSHEYWQYLFNEKHGNKARLVTSFTDLESYKLKANAISEDFKGRHKGKPKQITQWEMIDQLVEAIKTLNLDTTDIQTVASHCIRMHIAHKRPFCTFSIERIVVSAIAHVDLSVVAKAVSRSISRKLVEDFR